MVHLIFDEVVGGNVASLVTTDPRPNLYSGRSGVKIGCLTEKRANFAYDSD